MSDEQGRDASYDKLWRELSRAGDPARIPNKVRYGFDAGWQSRGEQIAERLRKLADTEHTKRFPLSRGEELRALAEEIEKGS